MSNESFRIRTQVGSEAHHLQINLQQNCKRLDILSLQIDATNEYMQGAADFGCLVGRVVASGVGIPNVKISIFIPLSEEDENNPDIVQYYPYKNPTDTDIKGLRYNLLPSLSILDHKFGWPHNRIGIGYKPKTPVGNMAMREEVITDALLQTVFEKYYKYTTVTNESGDFMIMGAPVGQYTIHMDMDISDIGPYSMNVPALIARLGYPRNMFTEDLRIKPTDNLDKVPTIQTMNLDVDIVPFWGDNNQQNIGITRLDFQVDAEIAPSFTLFGSGFTMSTNKWWGDWEIMRAMVGRGTVCYESYNEAGELEYKPLNFDSFGYHKLDGNEMKSAGDADIDQGNRLCGGIFNLPGFYFKWLGFGSGGDCATLDGTEVPSNSVLRLNDGLDLLNHRTGRTYLEFYSFPEGVTEITSEEEFKGIKKLGTYDYFSLEMNGAFCYVVFCNNSRKYTNEYGVLVPSNNQIGLFTEFSGYAYARMDAPIDSPPNPFLNARAWMKIPMNWDYHESNLGSRQTILTGKIRHKQQGALGQWYFFNGHTFTMGKIYSVAQFYRDERSLGGELHNDSYPDDKEKGLNEVYQNRARFDDLWDICVGHVRYPQRAGMPFNYAVEHVVGYLGGEGDLFETGEFTILQQPIFGNEWMNLTLYFPQYQYRTSPKNQDSSSDDPEALSQVTGPRYLVHPNRMADNNDPISPFEFNTKGLMWAGAYQMEGYETKFIEVPPQDIIQLAASPYKGFRVGTHTDVVDGVDPYKEGMIRELYGEYPKKNNIGYRDGVYLFKGLHNGDCIHLLVKYNIL